MVTCHKNPMIYLSGVWQKKIMSCNHRVLAKLLPDLYQCINCEEEFDLDELLNHDL